LGRFGKTQIGLYRSSDQTFYLGDHNGLAPVAMPFGEANDVPVTGDWDGSGAAQIGVWRPSTGTWYLGDDDGAPKSSVRVFVHRLTGTIYRPGDRLLITISAPGRVSERARITVRNDRKPLAALV
jgi:hypothetical protein